MHPSRQYKVPNVTQSPRTSLPLHLHPAVDGALKELKSAHRRLHVACAEFGRELQILNKLYYKGYNQHRLALFWKRTAEIRKYARRVDDADIASIADVLRRSFFGPEAQVKYIYNTVARGRSELTPAAKPEDVEGIMDAPARPRFSAVFIEKSERLSPIA
ncbi:hypothetical protein PTI98_003245 [Pleurotus ostreatus]|nr:hypothetical protein PTI98_003245 [Pleurotus ostreatus]